MKTFTYKIRKSINNHSNNRRSLLGKKKSQKIIRGGAENTVMETKEIIQALAGSTDSINLTGLPEEFTIKHFEITKPKEEVLVFTDDGQVYTISLGEGNQISTSMSFLKGEFSKDQIDSYKQQLGSLNLDESKVGSFSFESNIVPLFSFDSINSSSDNLQLELPENYKESNTQFFGYEVGSNGNIALAGFKTSDDHKKDGDFFILSYQKDSDGKYTNTSDKNIEGIDNLEEIETRSKELLNPDSLGAALAAAEALASDAQLDDASSSSGNVAGSSAAEPSDLELKQKNSDIRISERKLKNEEGNDLSFVGIKKVNGNYRNIVYNNETDQFFYVENVNDSYEQIYSFDKETEVIKIGNKKLKELELDECNDLLDFFKEKEESSQDCHNLIEILNFPSSEITIEDEEELKRLIKTKLIKEKIFNSSNDNNLGGQIETPVSSMINLPQVGDKVTLDKESGSGTVEKTLSKITVNTEDGKLEISLSFKDDSLAVSEKVLGFSEAMSTVDIYNLLDDQIFKNKGFKVQSTQERSFLDQMTEDLFTIEVKNDKLEVKNDKFTIKLGSSSNFNKQSLDEALKMVQPKEYEFTQTDVTELNSKITNKVKALFESLRKKDPSDINEDLFKSLKYCLEGTLPTSDTGGSLTNDGKEDETPPPSKTPILDFLQDTLKSINEKYSKITKFTEGKDEVPATGYIFRTPKKDAVPAKAITGFANEDINDQILKNIHIKEKYSNTGEDEYEVITSLDKQFEDNNQFTMIQPRELLSVLLGLNEIIIKFKKQDTILQESNVESEAILEVMKLQGEIENDAKIFIDNSLHQFLTKIQEIDNIPEGKGKYNYSTDGSLILTFGKYSTTIEKSSLSGVVASDSNNDLKIPSKICFEGLESKEGQLRITSLGDFCENFTSKYKTTWEEKILTEISDKLGPITKLYIYLFILIDEKISQQTGNKATLKSLLDKFKKISLKDLQDDMVELSCQLRTNTEIGITVRGKKANLYERVPQIIYALNTLHSDGSEFIMKLNPNDPYNLWGKLMKDRKQENIQFLSAFNKVMVENIPGNEEIMICFYNLVLLCMFEGYYNSCKDEKKDKTKEIKKFHKKISDQFQKLSKGKNEEENWGVGQKKLDILLRPSPAPNMPYANDFEYLYPGKSKMLYSPSSDDAGDPQYEKILAILTGEENIYKYDSGPNHPENSLIEDRVTVICDEEIDIIKSRRKPENFLNNDYNIRCPTEKEKPQSGPAGGSLKRKNKLKKVVSLKNNKRKSLRKSNKGSNRTTKKKKVLNIKREKTNRALNRVSRRQTGKRNYTRVLSKKRP